MRRSLFLACTALASALAVLSAPTSAATLVVSGTRQHINILNPPGTGRCATIPHTPPYVATVDVVPGPGVPSSSGVLTGFGGFAATMSHCIVTVPPTPFEEGIFSWTFDNGDVLEGVYTGQVLTTGTLDVFDATIDYVVSAGTGRFLGASGILFESGSFVRGPNLQGSGFITEWAGSLSGTLSLPAVPEPSTWALMLLGFGAVGFAMRRQKTAGSSLIYR